MAGTRVSDLAPVGVCALGDLSCLALLRTSRPVHTMVFHPTLPLLAIGTGGYDGGYYFEGELLLLDLVSGTASSLFADRLGREVRASSG